MTADGEKTLFRCILGGPFRVLLLKRASNGTSRPSEIHRPTEETVIGIASLLSGPAGPLATP